MFRSVIISVTLVAMFALTLGCGWTNTQKGAAVGTAAGTGVGAWVGNKTGNTAVGAIIGAVVGGAAGAYIGRYMDNQAKEIENDIEGARVERVGEGIKITFQAGLMFAVNKAEINAMTKQELAELATILNKYPDTEILLEGHTDSSGPDDYNLELSRKRANAVSGQLASNGVDATRVTIMGYGEAQPIADNETVEGRQQNRRVEVAIYANDKLKKVAEKKTQG